MQPLNIEEVCTYVNATIENFHNRRLQILSQMTLKQLVSKNPYLFRAKNITKASELIEGTLDAFLSSSEEKMFGDFLEDLAIFVAEKTSDGHKSGATGVDLEFSEEGWHYFISIKSGPNWGNSSQHTKLGEDLLTALNVYRQRKGQKVSADVVLGICYGKTKTARNKKYGYLKLVGQNFWTFVSGNKNLYKEIIEPVGYKAKEHNDRYLKAVDAVVNRITGEFIAKFCDENGVINWDLLVEANSGNYDLDKQGFNF